MKTIVLLVFAQCFLFALAQVGLERLNQDLLNGLKNHGMVLYEVQLNALQLRRYEKDYFLAANDPVERPRYLQLWRDYRLLLEGNLEKFQTARGVSDVELRKLAAWKSLLNDYARDFEASVSAVEKQMVDRGRIDNIVAAYAGMSDARKAIRIVLSQAQEFTDTEYAALIQATNQTVFWTRCFLIAALFLAAVLAFVALPKARTGAERLAQSAA